MLLFTYHDISFFTCDNLALGLYIKTITSFIRYIKVVKNIIGILGYTKRSSTPIKKNLVVPLYIDFIFLLYKVFTNTKIYLILYFNILREVGASTASYLRSCVYLWQQRRRNKLFMRDH